ncbi:mannose-1-phosphate guanylyltransferase/mannose-6-phosphate isomerase [Planctobacterium marinum]|uniref:mannose-1-phosphate guanylyltransferase n=1 Tax=Planctobacterium marinum TaxID=1631968 RepID=A0AA48KTM8_9ALTE|nr:mannose-1-phosphate guanylyltransferase/mannose-6-phosphate isomerase [Planctobacterium marinum]
MTTSIIPVILSGGAGTRLWPMSRKHYPKQFIDLTGSGKTMLQMSALRTQAFGAPIVVCSEEHRFIVAEQLTSIGITPAAIILEPVAKNTAAAIAIAAHFAKNVADDAIIAVFPADHLVSDETAFVSALKDGVEVCAQGKLVTFGVRPDKPETGYGYINLDEQKVGESHVVKQFVEKPEYQVACEYIKAGHYLWNSGMFMFSANTLLHELKLTEPELVENCQNALLQAKQDLDFIRLNKTEFSKCKNISIDYALMEKSDNVVSIALNVGWSDIGSWESIWQESPKDAHQNVLIGDVLACQSTGCFIHSKEKLTAVVGIDDLLVVDTDDSLLIIDKKQSQEVKTIVAQLEQQSRSERLHHRSVHRPWGSFDSIKSGERYQVKQLSVKPGASLSMQLHHHRAEHWIIVEGTAEVVVGDTQHILTENESIYIPVGEKHQLKNPGKLPLKVIEVQSGAYLAEDDIVRFNDPYNRD